MLLCFEDYMAQTRKFAAALGKPCELVGVHRFPDGESRVTLPAQLGKRLVFCRSLDRPNDKLVELLLAATAARRLGADHLTLVAPYLCYMRQDIAFHSGEAVSQAIIGRFLADLFDTVVTVDPHLHRTRDLSDAVPANQALALSAAPLMGAFLRSHVDDCFLLGPDAESAQWVQAVAAAGGCAFAVCSKTRTGDREVRISLPPIDLRRRKVVLLDDVASTGHTLAAAARQCLARGATRVDALVTHALFVEDAVDYLRHAGVGEIWSTDSVAHASNVIPLAELLAGVVTLW